MENINEFSIKTNKRLSFDTVVIGGEVGGCAAAISSARNGAHTLLVESAGVLGGQAVLGLVTPLDSRTTLKGESFGGILEEISKKTQSFQKNTVHAGTTEICGILLLLTY